MYCWRVGEGEGFTLLRGWEEHRSRYLVLPLLTPPPEGGEVLSRTARGGWWGWPRSRRTLSGRSEPLTRRVRALVWFSVSRKFLLELRRPAWDLEDNRRQFLAQDAGGQSCCWRLKSHFQYQVGTSWAWRWLRVMGHRVAAALLEGDSSSLRPSLSTTSMGLWLRH